MKVVEFEDHLVEDVHSSVAEFEQDVRLGAAIWFYLCDKLTLGQAADSVHMSQYEFMKCLSRHGISAIDYPTDELKQEIA